MAAFAALTPVPPAPIDIAEETPYATPIAVSAVIAKAVRMHVFVSIAQAKGPQLLISFSWQLSDNEEPFFQQKLGGTLDVIPTKQALAIFSAASSVLNSYPENYGREIPAWAVIFK